ncbi:MAG: hypothetical protein Q7J57_06120 [Gemmobacter sp.]|nr:hypothetical protein [Gemmobacter sp.]
MHFSGEITQKVDGKGRVSIPADFRRVLDEGDPEAGDGKRARVRIVHGDPRRKYLECYTMRAFDRIVERVGSMPEGSEDREILELFVISGSEVCEVDNDGRIVLIQRLRDKIGLAKDGGEAIFAGALQTFRIWKPEDLEAEKSAKLAALQARVTGNANVLSLLPAAAGADR